MKKLVSLIGCIILCLSVGGISGYFTSEEIYAWYATLSKPSFNPPNFLFGPVWTFLYITMGISFFFVVNSISEYKSKAMLIFFIQLTLNFLWSIFFFSLHNIQLALIDISLLWLSILSMIVLFYKVNRIAGLLQLPYLLWVTFATVLNAAIQTLN